MANREVKDFEMVLLDYSSPDALQDWVKQEMMDYIEEGSLVYYKILGRKYFYHAHAKNIAHKLAAGKIVCNVDADNFTGDGFAEYLRTTFNLNQNIIIRPNKISGGAYGRIAMLKVDFIRLGGYDERMEKGWGGEDADLIERARRMGLKEMIFEPNSGYFNIIRHSSKERVQYSEFKNQHESQEFHQKLSSQSIQSGQYVANQTRIWGSGSVIKNFCALLEI